MKNTHFRSVATTLLLLAIGLEVNHSLIRQVAWKGFDLAANIASAPLVVAWSLAIFGLWSTRAALKPWLVLGIFFLITHGIVIATGGNSLGAAYIFSGLIAAICAGLAQAEPAQSSRINTRPNLRVAS